MLIYELLNPEPEEQAETNSTPIHSIPFQQPNHQVPYQPTLPISTQRPGKVSKPISERTPKQYRKPRQRVQQSYSREFKIKVLEWWTYERIEYPSTGPSSQQVECRAPLMREVSERYRVPVTTLHNWRENQEKIIGGRKGSRGSGKGGGRCKWPELEANLYKKYQHRREERKAIRRRWFQQQARLSYHECYPAANTPVTVEDFRFSNGWFQGFLSRHSITLRFATNVSQKIPSEYVSAILSWLQFNRRNAQIRPSTSDELRVVGRYLLDSICNVDETPLPFEYLSGQTYADKGSRTVQVKASNSGWDKRQATIILAAFGSGKNRVRPTIIFRGKENYEGRRAMFYQRKREEETLRYNKDVSVLWNETAYANSDLLVNWINNMLVPALPPGPRLLALDVAKFHSTEEVLTTLNSHDIIPSMIPAGCTGLVQPLDVSINKPFKVILLDLLDNLLDNYETINHTSLRELSHTNLSAIAERRVLVTHAVGQAWEIFCERNQESVIQTFRSLGLTLPIDGSCDNELSVKGISQDLLQIGDWRRGGMDSETLASEIWEPLAGETASVEDEYDHRVEYVDRE